MAYKIKKPQRRLIEVFKNQKTFKIVNYNDKDFEVHSDGLAFYKGKMYGTKEDLKYFPEKVRLVEID